ncbi:MAG TPA: PAS domain-containing protein, partial [Chitinivibrionales bacterium]
MNIPKPEQTESEWKTALDELRLRESYLSAIIENLPGLLWMKDREGKFLAVNTQFAASCGFNDPSLLIGKTDFDIWPPNLAAGYVADDEKVILSGKP